MQRSQLIKLKVQLKLEAKKCGFADIRFTDPIIEKEAFENLKKFLELGYNGQMSWMENNLAWRGEPKLMWQDVKSIIVLAENYKPDFNPLHYLHFKKKANISVYARGLDYHKVVKKKLKSLSLRMGSMCEEETAVKIFVDTAPIMEKHVAQRAGMGWQGKHTNLVSKRLGNWFFLGFIFSNLDIPPDIPETDHCGSCRSCIDICPTNAFVSPYKLDASRCISYLTIEHKGPISQELRPLLGNRVYGCDDCLAICPWNKFSKKASEILYSDQSKKSWDLGGLAILDDVEFRKMFAGSPIKRIGRDRFVRNIIYAIGNSGDPSHESILKRLIYDNDFAVSDAANWALKELGKKNG